MKGWDLLIWFPQFGISVAAPLVIFILLARFLQEKLSWGNWIYVVCLIMGLITAAIGFRDTARAMMEISGKKKKDPEPNVFFNDHD